MLPTIRSYLKLYTTLPLAKLAAFMSAARGGERDAAREHTALAIHLLCFKHKMKNVVWTKGASGLDGKFQSGSEVNKNCPIVDLNFWISYNYSIYLIFHCLNKGLDKLFATYIMNNGIVFISLSQRKAMYVWLNGRQFTNYLIIRRHMNIWINMIVKHDKGLLVVLLDRLFVCNIFRTYTL